MRPVYLEMTAFGSYAEKTEVPFDRLEHGLYLVTGDTGAGKTTIFDAIMFALYGMASGTDRSADMLHCDHVPKSVDTRVILRFRQGEKEYEVERSLHFVKKRGTENQYGEANPNATLWEPAHEPLTGAKKVTARVEELLGLSAEQFRKIIMLAQGEFREFLKADSDKKNEILGKLFDSAPYLYYQNLLAAARDALKNQRAGQREQLRVLLQNLKLPASSGGEEAARYFPEHPELIENLRLLTLEDQEALTRRRKIRDELSAQIAALNTKKGAAEADNARLAELEAQRQTLSEAEAKGPDMERRKQAWALADKAIHRVKPALDNQEKTRHALICTLAEIEALHTKLAACQIAAREAAEAVEADAQTAEEISSVSAQIRSIDEQLPRYDDLARLEADRRSASDAADTAGKALEKERRKLEALTAETDALREKLLTLENADSEAKEAEYRDERAQERLQALDGESGVREEKEAIYALEKNLCERQERLTALTKKAAETEAHFSDLYRRFIAGQAGLLAEQLHTALETDGEAECPVCRSRLNRAQIPQLAGLPAETPNQKDVEAAKKAHEKAEQARSAENTGVETLRTAIEARKTTLLEKALSVLPDCTGWDMLCADGCLSAAIAEAKARKSEAESLYAKALAQQKERLRCKSQLPEKEEKISSSRAMIEQYEKVEREQRAAAQAADAATGELKKQLRHDSTEAAKTEKEALEEKQRQLAGLMQNHRAALDDANRKLNTTRGMVSEKENIAEKQREEQSAAEAALDRALREAGFESTEKVRLALAPIGDEDAEDWLKAEQNVFTAYAEALRHTREQVRKLSEQTAGKQPADLAALDEFLAALRQEYDDANDACAKLEAFLENHTDVFHKAQALTASLAAGEAAWTRLDRLASLAVGTSGEGGKLSFDRYVMGAVFREILEMANRRLELMSGGRYELVHRTDADRRNAKAGLEIEVLDNSTGLLRGSGSLSGGEAFFTSLSLALGLSDVVQNHAGGRQMEALFIDEGFGTLSDGVLDKALDVLGQLTEGNRLVGIISHVDKLDESIPQKIRVKGGEKGSTLTLELP